jgi:hypothetical protein
MDVEQLHVILQQSFSPDASLRNPAEETVRNLKHLKGAVILLMQVAAEKKVSVRSERTHIHTNFQSRRHDCCRRPEIYHHEEKKTHDAYFNFLKLLSGPI